jgi:hypothetical protein
MKGVSIAVCLSMDEIFEIACGLTTEADHQEQAAAQLEEVIATGKAPPAAEFKSMPHKLRSKAERNRQLANRLKLRAFQAGDKRYTPVTL